MRRVILAALFAAAIASPADAARDVLSQRSDRAFDATGLRTLRVENPRGSAEVKRSGDGQVHLWALKQVRATRSERERLARETRLEASREGDVLVIQVRYPQGPAMRISFLELCSGFDTPRVDMQLSIEVPPGVAVEMRSASGDLSTAGLAGTQRLATTSGDIRVEGATGRVQATATSGDIEAAGLAAARLRSVSGDISVDRATGALDAATTSGSITVKGAADSLELGTVSGEVEVDGSPKTLRVTTTSGDVTARGVAGVLAVATSSGDVDLHARPGLARAGVTTVSGDATLDVPAGFGGSVDLQTSSGALDVALPLEVKTVTRHLLRGTVGRGAARIELKSSSGDLHVTSGGTGS